MDQLRKVLQWLKRYHFWILSVLVVVVGIFCWWSAAGTLNAIYENNQRQIKEGFTNLANVRNQSFHPNAEIIKRQQEQSEQQAKHVAAIWQQLYERQRDSVLNWPSGPGELSPDFVAYVEKLDFGAEIPSRYLEIYQNYILNHFRKLPEKIHARELRPGEMGGMGGIGSTFRRGWGAEGSSTMTGQLPEDDDYLCEWDPADQAAVRAELEFTQQPSSLRIWITQENLWVYHTLLDVIRNTNQAVNSGQGATRMSNAAVRIVHSLEVGQRAAVHSRTPGRIYKVPMAASADAIGAEMPGGEYLGPGPGPGPGPGAGMMGEQPMMPRPMEFGPRFGEGLSGAPQSPEQEQAMLLSYRYLDKEGKPIGAPPAGGGGEAMEMSLSAGTPVDLASLSKEEFKRLPVRMVLQLDLRYLQHLLAECASQPLQVEVQEVRINPAGLSLTGGGFEGMGGMARMGGGELGFGAGAGGVFPERTGIQYFDPQPHIATVVVQGVIYIFNKPNPELLQPTTEGAQVAAF